MGDVLLKNLTPTTNPTSTQSLLLFDESTNAGQRINYDTLADKILTKLTSKTFTVAGGTNTLISAIDALNSKLPFKGILPSGTDLMSVLDPGIYLLSGGSTYENCPTTYGMFEMIMHVKNSTNRLRLLRITTVNSIWLRYVTNDTTTGEWTKLPNRDEMESLIASPLSNVDLNTLTSPDNVYYAGGGNNCTNVPTNVASFGLRTVRVASGYVQQILRASSGEVFERIYNGTTWNEWRKNPTRAEVDALNNKNILGTTVNANETKNITLVDGSHLYQATTRQGIYTLRTWVGGGGITALVNDSGVTTSVNGLVASFTFSSNNYLSVIQLF